MCGLILTEDLVDVNMIILINSWSDRPVEGVLKLTGGRKIIYEMWLISKSNTSIFLFYR